MSETITIKRIDDGFEIQMDNGAGAATVILTSEGLQVASERPITIRDTQTGEVSGTDGLVLLSNKLKDQFDAVKTVMEDHYHGNVH